MKRFFSVVFALSLALILAACTATDVDVTNSSATSTTALQPSSFTSQKVTTTSLNNESTTTIPDDTTVGSNVTTTTAPNTTTTTEKTTISNDTKMYSEHPDVPDYGAIAGVNHNKYKNGVYYYAVAQIQTVDPQNQSASQYMQLLNDLGYIALSPYDKDGVQGFLFGNSKNGTMVLFGAARDQGAVVVAISQQ